MTYSAEIQIEELRAELRNAIDGAERCQIEAELEIIQAPQLSGDLRGNGFGEEYPDMASVS